MDDGWSYGGSHREDLRDHRARAGPTACRPSAARSPTSRSGSSPPTCARWRATARRRPRPAATTTMRRSPPEPDAAKHRRSAATTRSASRRVRRGASLPALLAACARRRAARPAALERTRLSRAIWSLRCVWAFVYLAGDLVRSSRAAWSRSPRRPSGAAPDARDRPMARRRRWSACASPGCRPPAGAVLTASATPTAASLCTRARTAAHQGHRPPVVVGGGYRGRRPVADGRPPPTKCTCRSASRCSRAGVARRDPQLLGPEPQRQEGPDPGPPERHRVQRRPAPGVYRGQCAEFCGAAARAHGAPGRRRAAGEFEPGSTPSARRAARPRPPSERRGQEVFLSAPARMCHTIARHRRGRHAWARPDPRRQPRRRSAAGRAADDARAPGRPGSPTRRRSSPAANMPPIALDARRARRRRRLPGDAAMTARCRARTDASRSRDGAISRTLPPTDCSWPQPGTRRACGLAVATSTTSAIGRRYIVTAFVFFVAGRRRGAC